MLFFYGNSFQQAVLISVPVLVLSWSKMMNLPMVGKASSLV